jgi:trans-aconitate methyltransferase
MRHDKTGVQHLATTDVAAWHLTYKHVAPANKQILDFCLRSLQGIEAKLDRENEMRFQRRQKIYFEETGK